LTTALPARDQPDLTASQTSIPRELGWAGDSRSILAERISEIAALVDNWDSYGAVPTNPLALRRAQLVAERMLTLPLPAPRLFPVPDGGVQLEWSAGPVELELEIQPGGHVVFVCDDTQSNQRIDGELPANQGLLRLAFARIAAYA
jgi:hypothetical protein